MDLTSSANHARQIFPLPGGCVLILAHGKDVDPEEARRRRCKLGPPSLMALEAAENRAELCFPAVAKELCCVAEVVVTICIREQCAIASQLCGKQQHVCTKLRSPYWVSARVHHQSGAAAL